MSLSSFLFRIVTILALSVLSLFPTASIPHPTRVVKEYGGDYPAPDDLLENGKFPLSFVPNTGQAPAPWRFQTHGMAGRFFFAPHDVLVLLPDARTVLLRFLDANPGVEMTGGDRLPGTVNYFIGNDPARWRTNLPAYASIVYRQLYPGVDLRYEGADGFLKGTFTVVAGSDPGKIRWCYGGETSVSVDDKTGDLVVRQILPEAPTMFNEGTELLRERVPVAWQEIGGRRVFVPIRYVLLGKQACSSLLKTIVGFDVGEYDPAYPLIIDPTLEYSTYLGGTHDDIGLSIVVDDAGNAYITGATQSADFPVANAWQPDFGGGTCMDFPCSEVFVTKLSPDGRTLLYSTYLGGSDNDASWDVAIDDDGNVYLTGITYSTNFPMSNPLQPELGGDGDAFITKLSADGSVLLYSTYLGGNEADEGSGIIISDNDIYVTGITYSDDFPTVNPLQPTLAGWRDAFVARLNSDGSTLIYSTYLGGSDQDTAYDLATGSDGTVYITGRTFSTDFPTLAPFQPAHGGGNWDAFVAKLNSDGSDLVYSSYLGGSGWDEGHGIAVDAAGNAYIVGNTSSADFPLVRPFQSVRKGYSDVFVARVKADGSGLDYSTYLGGSDSEVGEDITVDEFGNVYVTGKTFSTDFPLAHPLQGYGSSGCPWFDCGDAFAAKLKSDGQSLLFSTYIGGTDTDDGRGIAVDTDGNIYITGRTWSTDYPVVNAFQPDLNTGYGCVHNFCPDGFVTKIALTPTTSDVDTYVLAPALSGGEPGGAAMLPIQYGNNGASDALSVTITATLDISLTYLSDTSGITPTVAGNTLVWNLPALVFLETGNFTLVTELPDYADYGERYGITIAITSAGPEAHPDDNVVNVEVMAARQLFLPWVTK